MLDFYCWSVVSSYWLILMSSIFIPFSGCQTQSRLVHWLIVTWCPVSLFSGSSGKIVSWGGLGMAIQINQICLFSYSHNSHWISYSLEWEKKMLFGQLKAIQMFKTNLERWSIQLQLSCSGLMLLSCSGPTMELPKSDCSDWKISKIGNSESGLEQHTVEPKCKLLFDDFLLHVNDKQIKSLY